MFHAWARRAGGRIGYLGMEHLQEPNSLGWRATSDISASTLVPASGVMHGGIPPYQSVTGRRARLRRKAACSWLPQSSRPSITPCKAIETRHRREHSVQAQTFDPDSLDL